jgi:hypothetical protein
MWFRLRRSLRTDRTCTSLYDRQSGKQSQTDRTKPNYSVVPAERAKSAFYARLRRAMRAKSRDPVITALSVTTGSPLARGRRQIDLAERSQTDRTKPNYSVVPAERASASAEPGPIRRVPSIRHGVWVPVFGAPRRALRDGDPSRGRQESIGKSDQFLPGCLTSESMACIPDTARSHVGSLRMSL